MTNNIQARYPEYDYLMRIMIVGYTQVGKSSLLSRYVDNEFNQDITYTVGVDFKIKVIKVGGSIHKLQLWDLAGNERFLTITQSYYRGANGFIFMYDVNDRYSYDYIAALFAQINSRIIATKVQFMLIGSKIDLDKRQVTMEEATEFARQHSMLFYEISNRDSTNIDLIFNTLVVEMKKHVNHKDDLDMFAVPKRRYNCA